jgi:uncharacterized protein (TIGR03437 family)
MAGELGGGNADTSIELFYLLTPQITATNAAALSFFTGGSNMPVAAATPLPSPTPSPTPTPTPVPGAPIGLAAGELATVRSTVALAPANAEACPGPPNPTLPCASETKRTPALPVELNGVSLSVNGAAAGLFFVGNDPKQINFVVPVGVPTGPRTVAINNAGTLLRSTLLIVPTQPDIISTTLDAGGRAVAFNVTNDPARTPEPFSVTTTVGTTSVPTIIELSLTGVRGAVKAEITSVTVGTTVISGDAILSVQSNPEMPGWDAIRFTLPASLAGAGDVPIQVSVTRAGFNGVSRPADTAPHITIN